MPTSAPLWPVANGPEDRLEIERTPLKDRGLPASTYDVLCRAARLWPDRPAASVLPDAERWEKPVVRTFGGLAADVHRFATVLHGVGVTGDPVHDGPVCGYCNGCIARFGGQPVDCYSPPIRARKDAMLRRPIPVASEAVDA